MKEEIILPKILYLTLLISKFAKDVKYYNTNDLIKLANKLKPELVRLRKDKNDYKFLDDTNFGGLRGNFSTLLTLRGIIKKGNKYTPYYGLGKNDGLFNAVQNGKIILDTKKSWAYTNDKKLAKCLLRESGNYSIREDQAHIKEYLEKNPSFKLVRDNVNFPKMAVLKSDEGQYFLRILFNTFIKDDIIEFSMLNYLKGTKIKQYNMHALFVIPTYENAWEEFYVIDIKELLVKTPLFMYFNTKNKVFYDNNGNTYTHFKLDDLTRLSGPNDNILERLNYDWKKVRKTIADEAIVLQEDNEDDEFSIFLEKFLKWNKNFNIYDKDVVGLKVSSSGGPDVTLEYSGGTHQKLELEHKWNNYILHKHYQSSAWKNSWLYADEKWDFEKIKQIFNPYLDEYIDNIPKVFLCVDDLGEKRAYEVKWDDNSYIEIDVK